MNNANGTALRARENMTMPSSTMRPVLLVGGACVLAVVLGVVDESIAGMYPHGQSYILAIFLNLLVPLIVAILPVAALTWALATTTRSWPRRRVLLASLLLLAVAALWYALGRWSQGLYGLDPPYVFCFVGWAMELVAMAIPFVVVTGAALSLRRRRAGS